MANEKGSSANAIIAIVSLLLVGVATFFVVKALKKPTEPETPNTPDNPDTPETPPKKKGTIVVGQLESLGIGESIPKTWFGSLKFPIRLTQKNDNVKMLQTLLLIIDPTSIKDGATGYFGTQTQSALKKILGKGQIDSQADLDKLRMMGGQKVGASAINQILSAQLGVKGLQIVK